MGTDAEDAGATLRLCGVVGALLLFVAATGWAVSLGVRASREPVRDGAVRAD
ncbi:hypothetical protein [Nocardioides sp. Arc9.136]|uniref:hypothetical protein n=1 Tax=Nocardioides sp. Arc9.136 TaxID=2996826 RepID=UPI00266537B3|nr:hypothetical protein [Nocardioides sp. Arc9.136]WKN48371.1 hypothetical protein OSR43_20380 [Nocardioides sp. Arc9.136]